jgi:hypothetical protein
MKTLQKAVVAISMLATLYAMEASAQTTKPASAQCGAGARAWADGSS